MTPVSFNVSRPIPWWIEILSPVRPAGLAIIAMLCSCTSARGQVDGKIIDADNAAPLGDVIVVAVWWQSVGLPSTVGSPLCAHVELTRSDAQGRFHFNAWSPPPKPLWKRIPPDKSWTRLSVYKRGFVLADGTPPLEVGSTFDGTVRLKKFNLSFEAHMQMMHDAEAAPRCHTAESYVTERPLLSQLEADAAAIASTPEQREIARREFDFRADDAEFNQSAHPDAHFDSPPPPPPSIIGTAPKAAPAGGTPY